MPGPEVERLWRLSMSTDPQPRPTAWLIGMRLPEFEPDPALWPRIQVARHREAVRRRWRHAGGLLALVVALGMSFTMLPQGEVVDSANEEMAQLQQRSSTLERDWLASMPELATAPVDPRLELIDHNLQQAYDDMASPSELIPLWRKRSQAMQEVIDRGPVRSITRI